MTHVHGVDDGVGYGVLGESAHGFGVYGYSDNGYGIYGNSTTSYAALKEMVRYHQRVARKVYRRKNEYRL